MSNSPVRTLFTRAEIIRQVDGRSRGANLSRLGVGATGRERTQPLDEATRVHSLD